MYPFDRFLKDIAEKPPYRVPGTAIFMTSNLQGTPPTLLHNLEHNRVLHERVILLTVATSDVPYVGEKQRAELEPLGQGFYRVALRYGFMQEPDVPAALFIVAGPDFPIDLDRTTFFLGIETLLLSDHPGMPLWKERLFVLLSRNAVRATSFFKIPPQRVVEIGIQVEL
jgi:KUP system potassium uptake protein